jgi:hypothetical protein
MPLSGNVVGNSSEPIAQAIIRLVITRIGIRIAFVLSRCNIGGRLAADDPIGKLGGLIILHY